MTNNKHTLFLGTILCFFLIKSACLIGNTPVPPGKLFLEKSVNVSSIESGKTFVYRLNYACASIVQDCEGVMITDPLPAGLVFDNILNSAHVQSSNYNAASRTVTFIFNDPLPAGTSGQVAIRAHFENGSTPNGTTVVNTATIDGSNANPKSASASITAIAQDRMDAWKFGDPGALDSVTVYGFGICNEGGDGSLDAKNLVLVDTLPVGSIYVGSTYGGTYNAVNHTVTWNLGDLDIDECLWPKLSLRFPSSQFFIGQNILNRAGLTYTPVGESPAHIPMDWSHSIPPIQQAGYGYKSINDNTLNQGQTSGYYRIDYEYGGSVAASNFYLIDTIPIGLRVKSFNTGSWYVDGPYSNLTKSMSFQTNLNTTWQNAPAGTNIPLWENKRVYTSSFGLVSNEYITLIRWNLGPDPLPIASGMYNDINIWFDVFPNAPTGTITNCFWTYSGTNLIQFNNTQNCVDAVINTQNIGARPSVYKQLRNIANTSWNGGGQEDYSLGDTVTFRIRARVSSTSVGSILNPILGDLLPVGLEYIPGSWTFDNSSKPGAPSPIFTASNNYNSTGRCLLKWSWTGASSTTLFSNETMYISFKAVLNGPLRSDITYQNCYSFLNPAPNGCSGGSKEEDIYDLDGDGNTSEEFCTDCAHINVNDLALLESEKEVRGALDTAYSKYPNYGQTSLGGLSDFRLVVRNTGTIPVYEAQFVDILPHVGDTGVVDLSARESRWKPNLVGPVSAPAGVSVFYSTATNPCRSAENIVPSGPVGCQTPNWTTVPPSDITSVRSLKFDFGDRIIYPGDELNLSWPMRAPVNALFGMGVVPDTIAWNSFGYIAKRTDDNSYLLPSEPFKVGISVGNIVPAVYGDYVWNDVNKNGIQDTNEPGLDGIRVELYRDNGDGIQNEFEDQFVSFSLTADGGYYLFPNLPAGDYYAVFYQPLAWEVSPSDQGSNENLDSDGIPQLWNNLSAAVAPITHLDSMSTELHWDLGLSPSNNGALGNYVWNDQNADGIQNESTLDGMNGVKICLYQSGASTPIDTAYSTNDVNGNPGYYFFDDLPIGNYFVEFIAPNPAITLTSRGATGSNDPLDSDPDQSTGQTEDFEVIAGQANESIDAGFILPSGVISLGNQIFRDDNDNGIFEPNFSEAGLNNVTINLYIDSDNSNSYTPVTDVFFTATQSFTSAGQEGIYRFDYLPQGNYIAQIAPSNFTGSGALVGYRSSLSAAAAPDPDNNVNNDDNGAPNSLYGILSRAISLTPNAEPTNDGDSDNNTNLTLDFGLTFCPNVIANALDSICVGAPVTLSAFMNPVISGQNFQWQSSADGVSNWTNVIGATTLNFTTAPLTTSTYYRVNVVGAASGCGFSNIIKANVAQKPSLTVGTDSTPQICEGGALTFTATTTGGTPSCQVYWQTSTDGGANWNDIPGGIGTTYTTPSLNADQKFRAEYRCTDLGCCD